MKYILLVFVSIVSLNCKERKKEQSPQQLTFIPAEEFLYIFTGVLNEHSKIDSIRLSDQLDTIRLRDFVSKWGRSNLNIQVKPASVPGGLGNSLRLIEWLKANQYAYVIVHNMSQEEKERFSVTDLNDFRKFQDEFDKATQSPNPERDGIALIFFIKKNGDIKYKISNDYAESQSSLIEPATTKQIVHIMDEAEESFKRSNNEFRVFIGGDGDASFKVLKKLLEVFKQKDFYKFKFLDPQRRTEFKKS